MLSTDINLDDGCLRTILAVVGIVVIIAVHNWMSSYSCRMKTQDMGFEQRYGWFIGCQIEVEEGKWIPLDSYYFKEE